MILAGSWFGLRMMELALYNIFAIILGILKDRERAEQKRARKAESLAAMGKAVSSLAHDLKTPLIAIGGLSRLVQRIIFKNDLISSLAAGWQMIYVYRKD